jgi:hypothetical protein
MGYTGKLPHIHGLSMVYVQPQQIHACHIQARRKNLYKQLTGSVAGPKHCMETN